MQNLRDLGKIAKDVLDALDKSSEMPIDYVAQEVKKVYDDYPEDPVLKSIASVVIGKLHKNALSEMSKEEFAALYDDVCMLNKNSCARDRLSHLMPEYDKSGNKLSRDMGRTSQNLEPLDTSVDMDGVDSVFKARGSDVSVMEKIVSAAEQSLPELRKYDKSLAKIGKDIVELNFKIAGIETEACDVIGDEEKIIYCVAVDSQYKKHYLFVPAILKDNDVQWPEGFISENGLRPISKENIVDHVNGMDKKTPDYGRLFSKTSSLDDSIEIPKPLKTLTAALEESLAECGTAFSRDMVVAGKNVVKNELESFGCRVGDVKVASEHDDGVFYSATIFNNDGKISVEVPVEFSDDRVLIPTTFACGDDFRELTAENVAGAISKHANSEKVCYEFSMDVESMDYNELRDTLLYSIASKDFEKAEEILHFVKEKYGEDKHKQIFADYISSMNAISKTASADKCRGCPYFDKAGKYHVQDYCNKLAMDASKVIKTASGCMKYERVVSEITCLNQGGNIKIGDK